MKMRILTASAAALALTIGSPASAGTDDDSLILGAVLGNVLSGKTTLGEKAGEIEGWMVVAPLLSSAATAIGDKVGPGDGILLVGAETPNLGIVQNLIGQRNLYSRLFDRCTPIPAKSPKINATGESGGGNSLADIIKGAPVPSTTITGYVLDPGDQALINGIQSRIPGWHRIDDLMIAQNDSQLQRDWEALRSKRDGYAAKKCANADEQKAILARFDALDTKLSAPGDKGEPSLLDQAFRLESLLGPGKKISVLRVHIESAGGSITNTDTLWTRLGVPAIGVTGALIISYRRIDPNTGASSKAGLVVCHAPKKTMSALHRGQLPDGGANSCQIFAS